MNFILKLAKFLKFGIFQKFVKIDVFNEKQKPPILMQFSIFHFNFTFSLQWNLLKNESLWKYLFQNWSLKISSKRA